MKKTAYATPGTKANKGQTTGVYFDKAKFSKILKKHGGTYQDFAQEIGRSNTWVYNCMQRGTMAKVDALALQQMFKVDLIIDKPYDELVAEQKAKKEAEEKAKKTGVRCTIKEVPNKKTNEAGMLLIDKLDELILAINKLGNIEMQVLEDVHKISKELTK